MKIKFYSLFFCLCFIIVTLFSNFNFNNSFAIDNKTYNCKSQILIEANSGKIIYENNPDEKLPIASIVKLMTLYIVFEQLNQNKLTDDTLLNVSEYASSMEGSQLFLDSNTKHKVIDLIKSVVICSANDSAVVLAEGVAGTETNFVNIMNKKARDLGLNSTLFVDSTGLNESGYSTARDVSILAKNVLANERYTRFSKIWLDEYTHPSGRKTELVNTNKLIRNYPYCISGKTGTTEKAGYCFTALCSCNNLNSISVILGAENTNERFEITKALFDEFNNNYKYEKLYCSGDYYTNLKLKNNMGLLVDCYIKEDFGLILKNNEELNITKQFEIIKEKAPIVIGETVGKIHIYQNDEYVGCVEIVTKEDVKKYNMFETIKQLLKKIK